MNFQAIADWLQEFGAWLREFLNIELFTIGKTPVTFSSIGLFLLILALSYWFSFFLQKAMNKALSLQKARLFQEASGLLRLIHYVVMLVGFVIAMQVIGIDLSLLFAAGAVFAVGLGFAVQNVAQNFVAGVILLLERAIKPGDVLRVEGVLVRVVEMGIRATIARTRDDEDLIIPNATLVQSTVTNYTLKDSRYRIRADVGVAYESDLKVVKEALHEAALEFMGPESKDWRILLRGFGDSTVNFELSIWIEDPWEAPRAMTGLLEAIWWSFKKKGVVIAFPQMDVHFDEDVVAGLQAKAAPQAKDEGEATG